MGYTNDIQHIYINSYTNSELFGQIESKASVTREGLVANTLRNYDVNSHLNMMHLIGECSKNNLFFYESLFNNDGVFLNQNNEKTFNSLDQLKIIWETDDLSHLSPSILTSSNLIYLGSSLTTWEHLIESVFQQLNVENSKNHKKLKELLVKKISMVKKEFDSKPSVYADVLPVTFDSKVRLALAILRVSFFHRIK
jgi:hypothetical protein